MRRRRARTLFAPGLAVVALGMGDCDENTQLCGHTQEDPRGALIAGFACLGVDAVDNKLPTASFTMTPNPVRSGGTVVFDASASSDPGGSITRYEWDVDPSVVERETERGPIPTEFEVDNGAEPVLERQVFAAFTEGRVGLRVTDSSRETTVLYQRLDITEDPSVVAAFSVSPRPAFAGQPVQFDASASTGAVDYSWDFEGNGLFTERSFVRTASHVYPTPGVRTVRLRVRGIDGSVVEAADMLDVRPVAGGSGADVSAIARAAARAAVRARGRRFSARLIGVSLPVDPDAITGRGQAGSLRGVPSTGRLVARGRRLGALRRFRRARFVARLNLAANLRTRTVTMRGLALATFPHGRGRACLRIRVTGRAGRRPSGALEVLGGSGAAAGLAARARFRARLTDGAVRLRGRVRTRTRSPRPLPGSCARLLLSVSDRWASMR